MIVIIQLELRCRAPVHNATSLYLPSLRKEEVDDNYPGFDGITFHFLGSILDVATPNDLSSQHQPPLPLPLFTLPQNFSARVGVGLVVDTPVQWHGYRSLSEY